jgi:hypothetical protein
MKKIKDGKRSNPLLTHMRNVAFGMKTRVEVFKTVDRMEKMRDDDAMIAAAEAKRKRKLERNKK